MVKFSFLNIFKKSRFLSVMQNLTFVTGNLNKLKEAEHALGIKLNHQDIDLHEIQEVSVEHVVEHKAKKAYELLKTPVVVEDAGLCFEAFNEFPGALIKWMLKHVGRENICKLLKEFDRSAKGVCAVGYYDGKDFRCFKGEVKGKIAEKPIGDNGFGWDPIFIPENHNKTFAEMSLEEKNKISHRSQAWKKFKEFLDIK